MTTEARHWDVAAYVLGVLDPAEVDRFEIHLADCDACADELESLLAVSSALAYADATDLVPAPAPKRVLPTVRVPKVLANLGRHPRGSRTGLSLVAVAATLIVLLVVSLSFFAGTRLGTGQAASADASRPPSVAPRASADAGAGFTSAPIERTDPATKVRARLWVEAAPFGTRIGLTLANVRGPLRCELLAYDLTGQSTVVSTWKVPDPGYGIPAQPNPLNLQTVTANPLADTARFEVRATDAAGIATTLIAIPL